MTMVISLLRLRLPLLFVVVFLGLFNCALIIGRCEGAAGSFVAAPSSINAQQQQRGRGFVNIGGGYNSEKDSPHKTAKTPQWSPPDSSNPTPVETALQLTADYSGAARSLFSKYSYTCRGAGLTNRWKIHV